MYRKARSAVAGDPHAAYMWNRALQMEEDDEEEEGPVTFDRSPFLRRTAWSFRPSLSEERPHDRRKARK